MPLWRKIILVHLLACNLYQKLQRNAACVPVLHQAVLNVNTMFPCILHLCHWEKSDKLAVMLSLDELPCSEAGDHLP